MVSLQREIEEMPRRQEKLMANNRIRVLLVDDHELARQGLRRMLELSKDIEVVGEASMGEEALELAETLLPNVVLMDIKMPGANGLETICRIVDGNLAGGVIILSMYEEYLPQAIEAGAAGYLVKDAKQQEVISAIRRANKGELVLAKAPLNAVLQSLAESRDTSNEALIAASPPPTTPPQGSMYSAGVKGVSQTTDLLVKPVPIPTPASAEQQDEGPAPARLSEAAKKLIMILAANSPGGDVTIMLTRTPGTTDSVKLRLGDMRGEQVMQAHNDIVRRQLAAHAGFEVQSLGNGFMLAFSTPRGAILCAKDIQRAISAYQPRNLPEPIKIAIGLHIGEPMKQRKDFFDRDMALAHLIVGQAQGGEILVSLPLRGLVEDGGDIQFDQGHEVELRVPAGKHLVYRAAWEDGCSDTVTSQTNI